MVSVQRWRSAQEYELGYWETQARQIREGSASQLSWYEWRANQLCQRLEQLGLQRLTSGCAAVVEVGAGPIGLNTFFPGSERVCVDPLAEQYSKNEVLCALRDPRVKYLKGLGEALPCPTAAYDLAIIENCIDHVRSCDDVMKELVRVLKPNGILNLTVNNRTNTGYYVHRVLSRLRIDRGHPHTFTPPRTEQLFERHGFRILDMQIGSYEQARKEDLASGQRKAFLKARLGISEFLVSVVAQRVS